MAIDVSTPVYEGPFDLLLQLILQEKVDIYEVDLAVIVDRYLHEIERMQQLDLDVATEFVLIAATLVELKTRRLLPGSDDVDLDEELALWEERDLLLARLIECKTFKEVAKVFSRLADEADLSTSLIRRVALLGAVLLVALRFASAHQPSERDARALARDLQSAVSLQPYERLVFVDRYRPAFGLEFYTGRQVSVLWRRAAMRMRSGVLVPPAPGRVKFPSSSVVAPATRCSASKPTPRSSTDAPWIGAPS